MATDIDKQIIDALDLDTWDEWQGYTNVYGPQCPKCAFLHEGTDNTTVDGEQVCRRCGKLFAWTAYKDSLLRAWVWTTRTLVRLGKKPRTAK